MIIIPAIDIYQGCVVRLEKGSFEKVTVYNSSPLKAAENFIKLGLKRLHIVDLEGSKSGQFSALGMVTEIKKRFECEIEFGGGIREPEDALAAVDAGVDYLIIGSMAVNAPAKFEALCARHSPQRIIAAVDFRDNYVAVNGWQQFSGRTISQQVDYCLSAGVEYILCTDISRDGMLSGVNNGIYETLLRQYAQIKLIASGGVSSMNDIRNLVPLGLFGVITGKALYENNITSMEIKEYAC